MDSYLNTNRPPVYCPGCTHEKITTGLDKAFNLLSLAPDEIVIVSDIGCSGLFDTFFNVHALHGAHGRALTYAAGIKLARPDLKVVVTMGDGGLGIGGAHVLAACRRNLDLTLIILNNFNFGMTGGQYSATTPRDAVTGSGFLNMAEAPIDICAIAKSAGATYIDRCSGLDPNLPKKLQNAISHNGFSIVETLGMCTGRYTRRNRLTPKIIDEIIDSLPPVPGGVVEENLREEYGSSYRMLSGEKKAFPEPLNIEQQVASDGFTRQEVVILGSAGMRIVTAGDLLCHAGLSAGMHVSVKNDYNITVLRGQSVSEVVLSPDEIGYTGITSPDIVIALSNEGINRKKNLFPDLKSGAIVLKEKDLSIPGTRAKIHNVDFKTLGVKKMEWAMASLGILAGNNKTINSEMLEHALASRFGETLRIKSLELIEKTKDILL